jgi:hypothetical protein
LVLVVLVVAGTAHHQLLMLQRVLPIGVVAVVLVKRPEALLALAVQVLLFLKLWGKNGT